jgi:hypothetical protein
MGLTNGRGARQEEAFAEHRFLHQDHMQDSKLALPDSGGKLPIAKAALAMSPYAKAAVAFAVAFASCAVAWCAMHGNFAEPTATCDSSMPVSPRRRGPPVPLP